MHSSSSSSLGNDQASTLLAHPSVVIKHPKAVLGKLLNILLDGKDNLHIITDFNMTLTKYWVDGKQNCDSFNVLEAVGAVSPQLIRNQSLLRKEYRQIETDPELHRSERERRLTDVIRKNNELYVNENFTQHQLTQEVRKYPIVYRDGVRDLVTLTNLHQIPLLVFTAGLGDVVTELLRSQDMLYPHMHVLSNFMKFDRTQSNRIHSFASPLIHTFNKGRIDLKKTPFYQDSHPRRNAILMGDSIGDLDMGDSLAHRTKLTIGFLNHSVDANLPKYMDHFDIVLTNDASMDWVNALLASL